MGPFGPYVQVGEDIEKPPPGPQPKKKKGRKKASVEAEMAANKPVKPKRVPVSKHNCKEGLGSFL